MNQTTEINKLELVLWFIGLTASAYVVGYLQGGANTRWQAIQHGSAIESVDVETGQMRFEWK